ncbi:hypothetical protein MNBD_BACTEROID02-986, partial [hydrothermal vent metagenome]
MSRIKYYIFVFLVLFVTPFYSQNNIEDDVALEQNRIEVFIQNAETETKQSNFYSAINILEKAFKAAEKINDKKSKGIILSKIAN